MTPPPKHPNPELLKKGDTVGVFWEEYCGFPASIDNKVITKAAKNNVVVDGSKFSRKDCGRRPRGMREIYICEPL